MEKSLKTPIKNYKTDPEWKHFFGSITRGFVVEEIFLNKAGEPVDYRILAMNKTGEEMWGLSAADSIGKTGHQIRSKSQKFLFDNLASVIKTGKSTRFEFFSERMGRFFDLEVFNPAKGIVAILISDITDRRNTEKALRESEDKFKYIFDFSVVGKSITLPSGEIHVNKAFSNMLGYSQEELQNKRWQEITHPDDIDLTQKEIDAFLTGKKKAARFIKRYLDKNGSIVWADIATSLRRGKDNKPLYFMTTIIDISEQKKNEEEIYRLSQRYSNLLTSIPEIIMEVNNEKVYTWANPAGYEFFGNDVIGKTAAHYFGGKQDTYDTVAPLFVGDENTFYVESWQRRKDGQKRLLAWWCRALKDEKGNVLGALSSAQDITERKQAEQALHDREQELSNIYSSVQDIIFQLGLEGEGKYRFLSTNDAFNRVTGLDSHQIIGKLVNEVIPEPSLRLVLKNYRLAIKENTTVRWEETTDYPTGRLTGEVSITPILDPDGKCTRLVGVVHDITERKKVEESLRRSQQETAHANRLLLALSGATQAAQRARTPEEVYSAMQEKMIQMGFNVTVFELTPEGKDLRLAYTNYDSGLVHKAEKITGLSIRDYLFHPRQGSSMQCALTQGKTVHVADAALAVADAMPRAVRPFARPVADMLHLEPSTLAPLKVDTETIGVLVVTGLDLSEADNPAVAAFANQTAIAIQNARLYEQAQHEITERKQAEEELRKSEEQWRSLVVTIPDYVALLDPDGAYLFLNHFAEGFSGKDITGKKAYDFINPESKQLFISRLEKCVKTKQTQRLEYQAYGSDKSVRLYEGYLAPIIEGDRVVNILSLAWDITERKSMEVALSKSEESFRNLFENSTVGLYRTTPNGKILLANPALVHMLGYESFKTLAERNLEKDGFEPGYKRGEFKKMVENDTFIQGLEIVWKKKDGSDIYIRESAKAIRHTSGKVQYYEGTVEDITERKKAETARQSSEIRYRRLFEAAKDGILILDSDNGRVIDVNPSLVEMLGISYKEIVDKELWELGFLKISFQTKPIFENWSKKDPFVTTIYPSRMQKARN